MQVKGKQRFQNQWKITRLPSPSSSQPWMEAALNLHVGGREVPVGVGVRWGKRACLGARGHLEEKDFASFSGTYLDDCLCDQDLLGLVYGSTLPVP